MTHLLTPKMPTPGPTPPPPPAFGEIQGQKPGRKSMAPTFLGAGVLPPTGVGAGPTLTSGGQSGKTLLGQ